MFGVRSPGGVTLNNNLTSFMIYNQEPRNLAWCNAPRVSLKSQENYLSIQTLDDKFTVLCRRLFRSHPQVGAAVSSYAHLINVLATRKACPYLSKLYWVNLCVR